MHTTARFLPFVAVALIAAEPLRVDPPSITLTGPRVVQTLLVETNVNGRPTDRTRAVRYRSENPSIASVSDRGLVRAIADGSTTIVVESDGSAVRVPVTVTASTVARPFHFENDIEPLLTRFNCNASGCHGKAEGQNGFKLSVFGFDPAADYAALIKENRGRRVLPAAPTASLLLTKASGRVAHGGGIRMPVGSDAYETIRGWIDAGTPFGAADAPHVTAIRLEPSERIFTPRGQQQLRVTARYSDGRVVDVTPQARFQTNNDALATVDVDGLITAGDSPGEAAVMAAYMGQVAVFRAILPRPAVPGEVATPPAPAFNFIDPLVDAKLAKLNLSPSAVTDDATFLRRVSLDVAGVLPSPEEARAFLADPSPNKRAKWVESLMRRPAFADYWALKWADLLQVNRQALGHRRAYAFYRWLREAFADNMPLDELARAVVTAEGPLADVPQAAFYRAVSKPGEQAAAVSQVFLGVRIACAECHHHPFDRWTQTDYAGMRAFFNPVALQPTRADLGGQELIARGTASAVHPRTGEKVPATPLGLVGTAPATTEPSDARLHLAAWMTEPDNPFFARNLANRTWAHFLGRGLVEPVDDVRATNPPTNPELLDALAKHLTTARYDFRALIRAITASRVYQTASEPNATNARDEQNYSRFPLKRPDAEVLLDMVCDVTGVPEKFDGMPAGLRAVQVWDSRVPHYFLRTFGRPARVTACSCERTIEPSVAQVLHLLNAPELQAKLSHDAGTAARLARGVSDNGRLAEEAYFLCFSRAPTAAERTAAVRFLDARRDNRQSAVEDLLWSLMNTLEFTFNH